MDSLLRSIAPVLHSSGTQCSVYTCSCKGRKDIRQRRPISRCFARLSFVLHLITSHWSKRVMWWSAESTGKVGYPTYWEIKKCKRWFVRLTCVTRGWVKSNCSSVGSVLSSVLLSRVEGPGYSILSAYISVTLIYISVISAHRWVESRWTKSSRASSTT